MRRLTLLIVLLLATSAAYAFEVSPASKSYDTPTSDQYQLRITNTQQQDITLDLTADGTIARFVDVGTTPLTLEPEETEYVTITITADESALPGTYTGGVLIEQRPTGFSQGGTVEALPAVRHVITMTVPPEGKFLDMNILTSTPSEDDPVLITVVLKNVGTEPINTVTTRIDVKTPANEIVHTQSKSTTSLGVGQKKNQVFEWLPEQSGVYTIEATSTYDGRSITRYETIEVGILTLRIGEITLGPFRLGEIVRVDVPVISDWNGRLRNVNADFKVFDENKDTISRFSAIQTDIAPKGQATLTGYWNTADLVPGRYTIQADIHFADKTETRSKTYSIGIDSAIGEQAGNGFTIVIILLIVVLIAIALWWYFKRYRD